MTRGTRSTRQSSRSPNRWGDLINPLHENGYDELFAQQRALLAAVDAVPTPTAPAANSLVPDEDLDAAVVAADLIFSPTPAAIRSYYDDLFPVDSEPRASERASASRRSRSRSVTPAHRRAPVGSTPTLPAQSPPVVGNWFGLPVYFDPSIPRAPTVSAVPGGEPSPNYYTPTSPAYKPFESSVAIPSPSPVASPNYIPFSPAYAPVSPAYDPNAGVIARRLDALERLQRRVDLRTDRIEAQLVVVIDALVDRRNGAAPAASNDRKRKRSANGRNVIDLTGATPSPKSPKKVDFVDLVTDSSWSGSRFSSDSSTSSSDSSSSSSSSSDDDDDDQQSTPSKKPKPSPNRSPFSPRSPKTPPNNRTPSPPRTPRKAPPRRPAPRTPPRQRAPSVPSTPQAPRKARGASRSPTPQAPRTPPQQTAPARPATPPAPRRSARIPKSKQREVEPRAPVPSRVTTRGQAKAKKAARKPRPNPTTYVRRKRT